MSGDRDQLDNSVDSVLDESGSSTPIDRSASSVDFGLQSPRSSSTASTTPSDWRSMSANGLVLSPSQLLQSRPSHLPAKSVAEERKHAAEVAKLVQALALKQSQEEREAERRQKERLKREDRLIESKREWLAVLSNWEKR
jgi:TBC1 domain family member 12